MHRILLIDDDEAVRSATKILLDAKGFEAVAVECGKSGVDAIRAGAFDLVMVDLFMPGMNGLETTKAIRQINTSVPIIAVSGFMFGGPTPEMPHFEDMAIEAGATAVLYKPFRPNTLAHAVQKAIDEAA